MSARTVMVNGELVTLAAPGSVGHQRGGPDCSAECCGSDAHHPGDPPGWWPECCEGCGGSGYACYPTCTEPGRRSRWADDPDHRECW